MQQNTKHMDFYINDDGNQVGPYNEDQIGEMIASGSLGKDDEVWHEGEEGWKTVGEVFNIEISQEVAEPQEVVASSMDSAPEKGLGGILKKLKIQERRHLIITGVACLVIGYFVGREHVKYQIRSAVSNAFASVFGDDDDDAGSFGNASEAAEEKIIKTLSIGETYKADNFSLRLDSAEIAKVDLKSMGTKEISKDPALIFRFTVTNTDERRILRFSGSSDYMAGDFSLTDDVDNEIRGVSYGMMTQVDGALSVTNDIGPSSKTSHVEVFKVPPPKTKYLVLKVDLDCLDGEGVIAFKIPASSISSK